MENDFVLLVSMKHTCKYGPKKKKAEEMTRGKNVTNSSPSPPITKQQTKTQVKTRLVDTRGAGHFTHIVRVQVRILVGQCEVERLRGVPGQSIRTSLCL